MTTAVFRVYKAGDFNYYKLEYKDLTPEISPSPMVTVELEVSLKYSKENLGTEGTGMPA